ncbi:MAG: alpha/beta hydrolase [Acidimicrobiaceae bacterium]|nr:alpha/beta hydrolase [Acidimicrobiaceae bacterium]
MIDRLGGLVRVGLVGLGVAGAGMAGGLAAERALVRRIKREPELPGEGPIGFEGVSERVVVADDGARLRVLEHGQGRPVVLLHGVTLAAEIWQHQLEEVAAAGFRVLAVDQRGHGSSGQGTERISIDRLAADLEEILAQLDLNDAVLIGHSMGGMVALRFLTGPAGSGPIGRRVGALGLVATTASPLRDRGIFGLDAVLNVSRPLAKPTSWVVSHLPGGSMPGSDVGLVFTRMAFGEHPSPSQVALTQQTVASVPARVTGALTVEILNFEAGAGVGSIDLPATVVVGSNDFFTPFQQAEALAGAIDGAELVVLDGCGHMVMLERHAQLSAIITELAGRSGVPKTVADSGA